MSRIPVFACFALSLLLGATPVLGSTCEVSTPNRPTPEGAPLPAESFGWFGGDKLAATIPTDGVWIGMGPERSYGDKFWWWKEGYSAKSEPSPDLTVVATRLDGQVSATVKPPVTNAYNKLWDAILVGMEFPSAGCWQIVGRTAESELKIVVQVGE